MPSTESFLTAKRHETDPLADQVVATIIDEGFEERINEIFYTLARKMAAIHLSY